MKNNKKSSYEGLQKNIRSLKTPKINIFKNQYPDRDYMVCLDIPEFTCVCPKTGLPDFAKIKVEYWPDKYCIELKSFKMYTIFYRNLGVFHENVINKIADDIIRSVKPRSLKIAIEFNARGGITTSLCREYNGDK